MSVSGERLNEHVTGGAWPSVDVRQAELREALEVIRLLWQGGYQSHAGEHYTVTDARVFDLPEQAAADRRSPPAARGRRSWPLSSGTGCSPPILTRS